MSNKNPIAGSTPRTEPSAVATPLPPLNPRNGEKSWPRNGARATRRIIHSCCSIWVAAKPITHPLPISPSKVRMPAFLPGTRATLVKPPFLPPTPEKMEGPVLLAETPQYIGEADFLAAAPPRIGQPKRFGHDSFLRVAA